MGFKKLQAFLSTKYFFTSVIIFFITISCVYQYFDYRNQMEHGKKNIEYIHNDFKEIKWETIESLIRVVNREGRLHSSLVGHILQKNVESEYVDLNEFKNSLDKGNYADKKFNSIIVNMVTTNSFMNNASQRNGIIVSCDDRILYNLIISHDKFDMSWKEFIEKNYNKKLAQSTFDELMSNNDNARILEPFKPYDKNHKLIERSSMEELKSIYLNEGLIGLYGYIIITPYQISRTGDIFNTPDFDSNGMRTNNHKIIVMSYISIYDIIREYHEHKFDNLDKLEAKAVNKAMEDLANVYYSSIKAMLFHILCILIVLVMTKILPLYIKNKN